MPSGLPDDEIEQDGEPSIAPASKIVEFWHRGSAWLAGPLFIGLVAVLLATGSEYATRVNEFLFHAFPWASLLIVPAGFALIVYITRRYFPGTQGSGIPQTIAAIDTVSFKKTSNLLSLRIMLGKVLLTLSGLVVGGSIGREGPTVQIGASIMHAFYGRGPFQTAAQRRILVLAGGAAGIAAAFNTPLAGIMFAIEELSKKHVFNANSSTVITVILSGLISLAVLGNYTYFGSTGASLNWNINSIIVVLICGLIGGAAGSLFSRLLIGASSHLPPRLANVIKHRPIVFAALCGLVVAILGILTDGMIFGTGYQPTRSTLENHSALPWYFGIAKMVATLMSAISGIPGGIFAPSLAVGAGIGDNLAALLPNIAPHSAVVLMMMAAYLSGVTRAPVTSFIIMIEMTNSHQMLVPLMTASVVASGVAKLICPTHLYQALAENFSSTPTRFRSHHQTVDAELLHTPDKNKKIDDSRAP